jgi:hypothetical protein
MKFTASPKTIIPIVSLLMAFSILAFQHHKNDAKLVYNDPSTNSVIIKSASKPLDSITDYSEN